MPLPDEVPSDYKNLASARLEARIAERRLAVACDYEHYLGDEDDEAREALAKARDAGADLLAVEEYLETLVPAADNADFWKSAAAVAAAREAVAQHLRRFYELVPDASDDDA